MTNRRGIPDAVDRLHLHRSCPVVRAVVDQVPGRVHAGPTLTVNGQPIGLREHLDLIGWALGRTIPLEELTPEQAAPRYRYHGITDEEIVGWLAPEDAPEPNDHDLEGRMIEGVVTVTRILGRRPRTYADRVDEHTDVLRRRSLHR